VVENRFNQVSEARCGRLPDSLLALMYGSKECYKTGNQNRRYIQLAFVFI